MKKITVIAMALTAFIGSSGLTSCSDENFTPNIEIPSGTSSQLTIDMYDHNITLPVNANGDWTATIVYADEDNTDWLTLDSYAGKGNATVSGYIPANGTNEKRSATVVFSNGDAKAIYAISQESLSEAKVQIDSNGELDMSKFGKSIPLGYGIAVTSNGSGCMVNSPVFCVKQWKSNNGLDNYISVDDDDESDLEVYSTPIAETEQKFQTVQSADSAVSTIGATLKIDVSFAMFKLKLNGSFTMGESNKGDTYTKSLTAPKPKNSYSFRYDNALSAYNDAIKNNDNIAASKILSSNFSKLKKQIEDSVAGNADASDELEKLDRKYGPVFCTNVVIGGSANITSSYTSSEASDSIDIIGNLSGGFSSVFSINVEASAKYFNEAFSKITAFNFDAQIKGGTEAARDSLMKVMSKMEAANKKDFVNDLQNVNAKVSEWSSSIDIDNPQTYTCTSYEYMPIWILFDKKTKNNEGKTARDLVKEYFKTNYQNKKDGNGKLLSCPYIVNIEELADKY